MKLAKNYRERIQQEFQDCDGNYWIYLKPFWKDGSDPLGCVHGVTENTRAEAYRALRGTIPCNCADCQQQQH